MRIIGDDQPADEFYIPLSDRRSVEVYKRVAAMTPDEIVELAAGYLNRHRCGSQNPDGNHGPAVAIWTCSPSLTRVPLCQPCLDGWLDNADDEPDLEPAQLEFLGAAG